MKTKTQQLREFFESGDTKKAMKIFKTFKIGITAEEKRTIEIASEVFAGKGNFYLSLGIDTEAKCQEATNLLKTYLSRS